MAMARYLGIASALAATSLAQFTPEYVKDVDFNID
jgi:hypothetical protein